MLPWRNVPHMTITSVMTTGGKFASGDSNRFPRSGPDRSTEGHCCPQHHDGTTDTTDNCHQEHHEYTTVHFHGPRYTETSNDNCLQC